MENEDEPAVEVLITLRCEEHPDGAKPNDIKRPCDSCRQYVWAPGVVKPGLFVFCNVCFAAKLPEGSVLRDLATALGGGGDPELLMKAMDRLLQEDGW